MEEKIEMTEQEFEAILKQTDWNYDYASGEAYRQGKASFSRACTAYKTFRAVDQAKADELWKKYASN